MAGPIPATTAWSSPCKPPEGRLVTARLTQHDIGGQHCTFGFYACRSKLPASFCPSDQAWCRRSKWPGLAWPARDVVERGGTHGHCGRGAQRIGLQALQERRQALSASTAKGVHDSLGNLPAETGEAVHRLVTDPSRITESWVRTMADGPPGVAGYVEIVSVTDAIDSGVAHGEALVALVDGVLGADTAAPQRARAAVRRDLGDAAFVDACAAIASFNAVVKLADATGIPIEDWRVELTRDSRSAIAIDAYRK